MNHVNRVVEVWICSLAIQESGKVIGNIYCGNRDFGAKEVGYIVNHNYQRKGYACEALRAVIENAFKEGVHRIYAECDPRNACSWKLLEKGYWSRRYKGEWRKWKSE